MDDDIKRLVLETCLALIPKFYDDVLEATRIQQVHDAIIEPFSASIMRLHRNACIQTMDADALMEMEDGLGIVAIGSLEQRRQAVINALCDIVVVNDATLLELLRNAANSDLVQTRLFQDILKLEIYTNDNDNITTDHMLDALETALKMAPQNLVIESTFEAANDKGLVLNHAHTETEICETGEVKGEEANLMIITWGDEITVPGNARLTSPIKSRIWWAFGGYTWGSNNNHGKGSAYTPIYADGSESGSIPDNIHSAYRAALSDIGEGKLIKSGLCANTRTGAFTELTKGRINVYNGAFEVYSQPAITQTQNTTLTMFEFDIQGFDYPLPFKPVEIYTINDTSISWNDTGYISQYLTGKPLQVEYWLEEQISMQEFASEPFELLDTSV